MDIEEEYNLDRLLDDLYQSWSKTNGAAWHTDDSDDGICKLLALTGEGEPFVVGEAAEADADFIALAWNAVPFLIEKYRELEDAYERLEYKTDQVTADLMEVLSERKFENDEQFK